MTLEQAQAWVLIITALGTALAAIVAAIRAGKANENATVAKNQAALNQQTLERTETKLDENTRMTAEVHGMSQSSVSRGTTGRGEASEQ